MISRTVTHGFFGFFLDFCLFYHFCVFKIVRTLTHGFFGFFWGFFLDFFLALNCFMIMHTKIEALYIHFFFLKFFFRGGAGGLLPIFTESKVAIINRNEQQPKWNPPFFCFFLFWRGGGRGVSPRCKEIVISARVHYDTT